ncbi:MAG: UPF0149 family protein [Rubrivivax sp.]|nr:UPF0149 family protein [Rubrivivax sp.]
MQYPAYDPQSAITPLTAEEIAALDALLQRLEADTAMSLDGVDGYLTALAIGPAAMRSMPTSDWLPLIWGGDPAGLDETAPFATKRQRKNTVVMALRHLRHLSQLLHEKPDEWEPIFSIAEQGADEWADAREWCMGFLQAVDLMPDAWSDAWADPALAPVVAPLVALGGGLDGAPAPQGQTPDLDDPAVCDELSRAVPDAVSALQMRFAS